jgi:hypothetical protein
MCSIENDWVIDRSKAGLNGRSVVIKLFDEEFDGLTGV